MNPKQGGKFEEEIEEVRENASILQSTNRRGD